jgi:hypothetical protein
VAKDLRDVHPLAPPLGKWNRASRPGNDAREGCAALRNARKG